MPTKDQARRRLLKLSTLATIPLTWKVPVVKSVLLPAHASISDNTSECVPDVLVIPGFDLPCSGPTIQYDLHTITFDPQLCQLHDSVESQSSNPFPASACFVVYRANSGDGALYVAFYTPTGDLLFETGAQSCGTSESDTFPFSFDFSCGGFDYQASGSITFDTNTGMTLNPFHVLLV